MRYSIVALAAMASSALAQDFTLPVVSSTLPQETSDVDSSSTPDFTLPVESTSGIFQPNSTSTMATSSTFYPNSTTTGGGGDTTITSTQVVPGPTNGDGDDGEGDEGGTTSITTSSEPGAAPTKAYGNAAAGLAALVGLAAAL